MRLCRLPKLSFFCRFNNASAYVVLDVAQYDGFESCIHHICLLIKGSQKYTFHESRIKAKAIILLECGTHSPYYHFMISKNVPTNIKEWRRYLLMNVEFHCLRAVNILK